MGVVALSLWTFQKNFQGCTINIAGGLVALPSASVTRTV
jgi:hypothetical protein